MKGNCFAKFWVPGCPLLAPLSFWAFGVLISRIGRGPKGHVSIRIRKPWFLGLPLSWDLEVKSKILAFMWSLGTLRSGVASLMRSIRPDSKTLRIEANNSYTSESETIRLKLKAKPRCACLKRNSVDNKAPLPPNQTLDSQNLRNRIHTRSLCEKESGLETHVCCAVAQMPTTMSLVARCHHLVEAFSFRASSSSSMHPPAKHCSFSQLQCCFDSRVNSV